MAAVDQAQFQKNKEFFRRFLARPEGSEHAEQLQTLVSGTSKSSALRLTVDLNALRRMDPLETQAVIRRPMHYMSAFQEAAAEYLRASGSFDPKAADRLADGIQIGFRGSVGAHHMSPRGLVSNYICSLVCVEGVVTKCSLVQPKVVKSVHWCEATKSYTTREYRDATALDLGVETGGRARTQTSTSYPTVDDKGNPLETEFGLSQYKNHQTVVVQEMPERAPLGQLPRSVEIVLDYDLVDKVKPGDRVQCMGVYRAMGNHQNGTTSGVFKTKVLCNHLDVLGVDVGNVTVSAEDAAAVREVAARPDVLELLARSLAPSVYGHELIKRALVLQLLGGCEKNLANGTHLRGDLNILMVGDPSTAKSQLLRATMGIAPLAVSTTGRGSSGVGLTAAVTNDAETGERKLEAGAMVLADRGVVCIDEFDKMSDADRVAIHEVMEQQTVTVAKAGIHASLNARCSVLAAANPVYGQYNKDRRPQDNIGLPDSLLSRFDMLFVVLDQMEPETDRKISMHVLAGHMYRRPGTDMEPESLGSSMWECETKDEKVPVWSKAQPALYGAARAGGGSGGGAREEVLHKGFLKKFLHYAKQTCSPTLTDEAREFIATEYAGLRAKAQETNRTLPVTARQLETLIRVSTAHAKARLSPTVDVADAAAAAELVHFALYHETGEAAAAQGASVPPPAKKARRAAAAAPQDDEEDAPEAAAAGLPAPAMDLDPVAVAVGGARYELMAAVLARQLQDESLPLANFLPALNAAALAAQAPPFSFDEAAVVAKNMEAENVIMFDGNDLFSV